MTRGPFQFSQLGVVLRTRVLIVRRRPSAGEADPEAGRRVERPTDAGAPSLEVDMEDYEVLPARERWDDTRYAVACFLARYRDATLRAYQQDMLAFLRWCAERHAALLQVGRHDLVPA